MNAEPEAKASFQKRWRITSTISIIWLLTNFPSFWSHWPSIVQYLGVVYNIGAVVTFGFFIWAFRCTVCGGGIKLNGKTCSKCGRVFR